MLRKRRKCAIAKVIIDFTNCTFQFNTWNQSLVETTAQTQGISFNGNVGGTFIAENVLNNTFVADPNPNVINTFVNSDMSRLNGTLTVQNNWVDSNGLESPLSNWVTFVGGTGPFTGILACNDKAEILPSSSQFREGAQQGREIGFVLFAQST